MYVGGAWLAFAACEVAQPARVPAAVDAGAYGAPLDASLDPPQRDASLDAEAGSDAATADVPPAILTGFSRARNREWTRETTSDDGRVVTNVDGGFDLTKPSIVIVYASPNGNTLEQTLGRKRNEGESFRYDIQHVLAQTRLFRGLVPQQNVVLVVLEEKALSWPVWVKRHSDAPARARALLLAQASFVPSPRYVWASHSGGGSLVLAAIDGGRDVPAEVDTILFLDSHYAFEEKSGEGTKLAAWLKASTSHRLVAIAYDDRNVLLHKRRIVSPKGGSYRATDRMRVALQHAGLSFGHDHVGPFDRYRAADDRVDLRVHPNREKRILHSALVSDENGYVFGLGLGHGAAVEARARFGRPRVFEAFVDPAPELGVGDGGAANVPVLADGGEPDGDLVLP